MLAIVGTGLAATTIVITILSILIAGVNTRIDDVRDDVGQLRDEMREDNRDMRTRLRGVEVAFGKVEQRLETLERVILPPSEAREGEGD